MAVNIYKEEIKWGYFQMEFKELKKAVGTDLIKVLNPNEL